MLRKALYGSADEAGRSRGRASRKITIYRRPLERLYGRDPGRLRSEAERVVLHELAHHFGISDARLIAIDRY